MQRRARLRALPSWLEYRVLLDARGFANSVGEGAARWEVMRRLCVGAQKRQTSKRTVHVHYSKPCAVRKRGLPLKFKNPAKHAWVRTVTCRGARHAIEFTRTSETSGKPRSGSAHGRKSFLCRISKKEPGNMTRKHRHGFVQAGRYTDAVISPNKQIC